MGVATISAQTSLQLRVDPEAISFGYNLNVTNEDTYGGRVVQVLSTEVTDLTLPCVSGAGGRRYLSQVATFFKDMMIWQRDSQAPAVFSYPPRNYTLHVYASELSIDDALENVNFPFTMKFKVSEDAGGFASGAIMAGEINKLIDGVGYTHNQYNTPFMNPPPSVPAYDPNAGLGQGTPTPPTPG